jgi:hypothetical protein
MIRSSGVEPVKHCACGRSISPDSWGRLRLVGTTGNGRGIGEVLELRNCACGSTLAKPIGVHGPPSSMALRSARRTRSLTG